MKRKLGHVLAVLVIAVTGSVTALSPAAASPGTGAVCILLENTWLRDWPWGNVMLTLHAGRGFRVHAHYPDPGGSGTWWFYGHGAEAPDLDGWIPVNQCGF